MHVRGKRLQEAIEIAKGFGPLVWGIDGLAALGWAWLVAEGMNESWGIEEVPMRPRRWAVAFQDVDGIAAAVGSRMGWKKGKR